MDQPPNTLPEPETPVSLGTFQRLAGVLWAPERSFRDIVQRPTVLVPMLVLLLFGSAFTLGLYQRAIVPMQMEAMRAKGNVPPEQMQRIEKGMSSPAAAAIGTVFANIAFLVIYTGLAGILYFVFTLLSSGRANFKTMLSIVLFSQAPGLIKMLLVFPLAWMKQDMAISLGPAALMDRPVPPTFAYTLLTNLDLFYLWVWLLLAIGIAVANRKPVKAVLPMVLVVYAVITVCVSAMSLLQK